MSNTSAPSNPVSQPEAGSHLVTEAETLCNLLGDMGVTPAVDLTHDRLFVTIDTDAVTGAMDVLRIVVDRFSEDADFREDVITSVAHTGYYLTEAPAILADLKTAPGELVIRALAKAGLLIRHHYERSDGQVPMLSFMPVPGEAVAPNAHMLMKLAAERFQDEPAFAREVTQYVIARGQSQHDA